MSSIITLRATRLALAVLALSLMGGCGIFSPEETKDDKKVEGDFKDLTEKDHVIHNLEQAYLQRDYDQYVRLRHSDFQFQFPVDEFDLSETADGRWDAARDGISTERMLGGETSKEGQIVQDISLSLNPKSLIWTDSVEPEFEGSWRRTYEVQMDVSVSGGTIFQVRGEQEFYIQQVQDGENLIWKLRFWRDEGVPLLKNEPLAAR